MVRPKTKKAPEYTGLTYGTTGPINESIPEINNRNTNVQPAATNNIDNTTGMQTVAEEESVAMNMAGEPVITPLQNANKSLNILRDTERDSESLTAGASGVSLSSQEIGDLDFTVFADLADNSDVDALRQAYNL